MIKLNLIALLMISSFAVQAGTVTLSLNGLDDLGANARYEGWLIVDGSPVSTGVFSVDGSGVPSQTEFMVDDYASDNASLFVLTIEPYPDADSAPAATHILAGEFSAGIAAISVGHAAALGDDFSAAAGTFILAAPSDTGAVGSYKNGIWYLVPPTPDASLVLPTLPAGWIYEGWVVDTNAGVPTSTGTFSSASGADSDGGGSTAGPGTTPPFPGQDFINPLTDLTVAHAAVISVEPVPDNSPMPFTLKPLVATISDPGEGGISQSLANNASASNPSGRATIQSGNGSSAQTQGIPTLGTFAIILLLLATLFIARRKFVRE